MDVSMPIRAVTPTLDAPVLQVLVGVGSPLTATQVNRIGPKASLSGVIKVLDRLVGTGLVLRVPGGYVLNRSHLAAPAVENLASMHGELLRRLRASLEAIDGVVFSGLFGSAARRDGDEHSDIDMLLVTERPIDDGCRDDLAQAVHDWTGNRTQIVALTARDLADLVRRNAPLVESWRRDLVVLAGDASLIARIPA